MCQFAYGIEIGHNIKVARMWIKNMTCAWVFQNDFMSSNASLDTSTLSNLFHKHLCTPNWIALCLNEELHCRYCDGRICLLQECRKSTSCLISLISKICMDHNIHVRFGLLLKPRCSPFSLAVPVEARWFQGMLSVSLRLWKCPAWPTHQTDDR